MADMTYNHFHPHFTPDTVHRCALSPIYSLFVACVLGVLSTKIIDHEDFSPCFLLRVYSLSFSMKEIVSFA